MRKDGGDVKALGKMKENVWNEGTLNFNGPFSLLNNKKDEETP